MFLVAFFNVIDDGVCQNWMILVHPSMSLHMESEWLLVMLEDYDV